MHKKVYDSLLEALPNYRQIDGNLIQFGKGGKPEGHCFMGVLYDLAVKAGVVSWEELGLDKKDEDFDDEDFNAAWGKVWDWAGIEGEREGGYGGFYLPATEEEQRQLGIKRREAYMLNDQGSSFEELAERLRQTGHEII